LPSALAADGVAEFIEIMIGSDAGVLTGEVTLTATDTGESWRVGAAEVPGDAGSAEVRAAVSDLVLVLYRRLPVPDAIVDGDPMLMASLLSLADTS
jgi:hypothetical protein